tara:strand:- start:63 stop:713 length:651 start_codon:yes stop_codon:yes gene_type:complete
MHKSIINLNDIKKKLYSKNLNFEPRIIAVSKTFSMNHISPLIENGHIDFGENKVQEAIDKWSKIKIQNKDIKLHMIGKLQTNKVKYAINLFDYIHSLDSSKLAKKISEEQNKTKKKLKIFIQINIGKEEQKNGINEEELNDFYKFCTKDLDLDIIGLMCLPPINTNTSKYFQEMEKLAKNISIKNLSMGMSEDYLAAVENGGNFLRIGSKIFGKRI